MTSGALTGPLYATAATSAIGLSVAVSKLLIHYPVLSAQAVRYAIGATTLLALARLRHQRLPRPTHRDLALLLALGAVGLAGFNILLLAALANAEPAAVGVVVGCVPVLLALAGPLLARRVPSGQVVAAAVLAAVGAGVVQGGGEATAAGLATAAGALAAEALFSLLAVPLLPRLGPLAVSAYACLAAVVLLGIGAPLLDGRAAFQVPTLSEAGAVAFLGLVVTAGAFVAWYAALERLGVERAGLFNGLVPIATLTGAVLIGTGTAGLREILGATLVGAGIVLGLLGRHPPNSPGPPPHPQRQGPARPD
jgi:drug/metabolite transporter (DMT)-like permease